MLYTPREKDEEENLLLSIAMALTLLFPISGDSGLLSNAGGFLKARKKLSWLLNCQETFQNLTNLPSSGRHIITITFPPTGVEIENAHKG